MQNATNMVILKKKTRQTQTTNQTTHSTALFKSFIMSVTIL